MVARNRIRCTIISVPAGSEILASRGAIARELVPGADPYVAQLIKNLQDEVRHERRLRSCVKHYRLSKCPNNRIASQLNTLGSDGSSQGDYAW